MTETERRDLIDVALTGLAEYHDQRLFAPPWRERVVKTSLDRYPLNGDPEVAGHQRAYECVRDRVEVVLEQYRSQLPEIGEQEVTRPEY